jgi:hypothetical protein
MLHFLRAIALIAWTFASTEGLLVQPNPVQKWSALEITLTAANSYANAYLDVDVFATFYSPLGRPFRAPGFWDGGQIWRVRFAANETGTWRFSTIASRPDAGLAGQSGNFLVLPYNGSLGALRHGFLKVRLHGKCAVHVLASLLCGDLPPGGQELFFVCDRHVHAPDPRSPMSSRS